MNPTILGYNLFAYCENNPINHADRSGHWFIIDDIFTGLFDELIVFGVIGIISIFGVKWAQDAGAEFVQGVQDFWNSFTTTFDEVMLSYIGDYQYAASVADELTGIAGKYGNLECVKAKQAI